MDNFHFNMTCEGNEALSSALKLVWDATGNAGSKRGSTHYAIRQPVAPVQNAEKPYLNSPGKPLRMVFFSEYREPAAGDGKVALPFWLDAQGAADFASRWLAEADYGEQPDHDGDNGRGWRVYNEGWGCVDSDHAAIIAVAPAWAMYGK